MKQPDPLDLLELRITAFQQDFSKLHQQLTKVIVGQEQIINDLLVAVLSGGHVLLEGYRA